MSVERRYHESFTAALAAAEKQMQQNYRPIISVHKWFARRPGSLFRALALAELADRPLPGAYTDAHQLHGVCLDPFMGGGSPLFEAARLGLSVIGYDTNPMARWIVERELEPVDCDELRDTGEAVAAEAELRLRHLYVTTCPDCGADAHARYFLWLRHHRCECGTEHPLLADTKLVSAAMGRHHADVHCCPHCLKLSERRPGQPAVRCGHCRRRYETGLTPNGSQRRCDGCGEPFRIPPQGAIHTPSARLIAVEVDCRDCSRRPGAPSHRYKAADERDRELVTLANWTAATSPSDVWPQELIPRGGETERLLRWGYNQWTDLFGSRQLHSLAVLAERIAARPDGPVKRALATCFSDALRFQNMLCRYDRQALKPTDVFVVHGFPVPRVSCEVHPLGMRGVGSGGFRHMLAKYERAKRWCERPYETVRRRDGRLHRIDCAPERVAVTTATTVTELQAQPGSGLLRRGALTAGHLPDESVDLVLTDPPYYDNVQYAQLMELCYTWLRRLAPGTDYFDVAHAKTDEDAVGVPAGGEDDMAAFAGRLSDVYVAAAAALRPGGMFAFTYHHNDLPAYAPLVVACADAGLTPTRVYACPSEMRVSRHIHERNASTVDAVFVLRKPPLPDHAVPFDDDPAAFLAARVRALRRAGLPVSDADRACLRHAHAAARAIVTVAAGWDADAPIAERLAAADAALTRAPTPAAA